MKCTLNGMFATVLMSEVKIKPSTWIFVKGTSNHVDVVYFDHVVLSYHCYSNYVLDSLFVGIICD